LELHVVVIQVKELPSGFRLLSTEASSFESLRNDHKQSVREIILCNQTNEPETVYCIAMFHVDATDATNNCRLLQEYGVGPYSNLAEIKEKVAIVNGRLADLIKMLNKEN
jgi:hypothetical protein